MQMQYGEAVRVEYVDMADPKNQAEFSDLLTMAEEQHWPYPLVAINGHLRAAGSAQYYQILPFVEEALAAESVANEA